MAARVEYRYRRSRSDRAAPPGGGPTGSRLARAAPSTRRHAVTVALAVAFVLAFPLGFTMVMFLDVPGECRMDNGTSGAIEACIDAERDGLWWLPQTIVAAVLGASLVVAVGALAGLRSRSTGLLVGALATTVALNVALSRGLTSAEITSGVGFVGVYLPTTAVMAVLTLRWVPPAAVDGDRVAVRAWTSLVVCAAASLAVSRLLGTHEALLRWFGPMVVVATLAAVLVAASLQRSDRVVRSRCLASVLMPIGCGVALLLGLLAS